jgi:hypothetical protein
MNTEHDMEKVEPEFYAELIESATRPDGNYYIENDNGFPWTAVKVRDNQITAQDFAALNDAWNWLQNICQFDNEQKD